jgi:signal transduction histidine kinase/streptogramin lyase
VVANGCVGQATRRHWLLEPTAMRRVFPDATGRLGMQEDHRGGMWFYDYGGGLVHVNADGQMRQLTTDDGFPGDRVYCFMEDREGDWWAGLDAVGLVRVRPRQIHKVFNLENNPAKAARSIAEDRFGQVWIGRLSGGLGCWQDGAVTNFAVADSAGANSVFCVCPDAAGRLWLSGGDEDLLVREHGEIKRIMPVIHGVKALLADRAGRIWVGTTSGLLVSEHGAPDGFQALKGMPRRTVRALTEDSAGTLWGGTGNGELFCISNNALTLFRPEDAQASAAVWSVFADADGTKWMGTFRGGLLRFRAGKFTRYGKRNELPDEVICQILDDQRGNLWLGSHAGVFSVTKSALDAITQESNTVVPCVTYGRSDGLPSQECSGGYQPAAWRDHAGRLWFATAKGAAWLQPDEIRTNPKPPPVVIEELLVDGRLQAIPKNDAALEISPGRHQIEFHYTGLSLASPDRVQFRYQLDGLDAHWVQAGTRRSARYEFLPPGHYRFQVLACNSDGIWNETGSSLALNILPHYYESWWFRTLAVVIILSSVAGAARYVATRRLHRKMEDLERKRVVERERARIAKDIHDDLGASLTLIAVLGDLARKEKTGERIEKMSSTARNAVKSLDEIVWAVNPRNDTLAHLVDYTGQFATDYLRDAGIRCLLDVPDQTPVREVPANIRHNVFLTVKEALQNIVKHAHATEVWLRINTGPADLRISIEDNGCGFDRPPQDAWADGLRNMRQRLAEVGGECQISSQVKVGTSITVQLPLPANA